MLKLRSRILRMVISEISVQSNFSMLLSPKLGNACFNLILVFFICSSYVFYIFEAFSLLFYEEIFYTYNLCYFIYLFIFNLHLVFLHSPGAQFAEHHVFRSHFMHLRSFVQLNALIQWWRKRWSSRKMILWLITVTSWLNSHAEDFYGIVSKKLFL